ncbi:hypothetical protein MNEG_16633, partial [Monoraphidium neglectum]
HSQELMTGLNDQLKPPSAVASAAAVALAAPAAVAAAAGTAAAAVAVAVAVVAVQQGDTAWGHDRGTQQRDTTGGGEMALSTGGRALSI